MTMRRRDVLRLSFAMFPTLLAAQRPRVYRIGWLSASMVDGPPWEAFIDGMRERGWVEGQNVAFERLTSGGRNDRFPALVAELVRRNVDVIVAAGTPPAVAARDGTTTIPIVFYFVGDPVGSGLVDSLARPGRNLTGTGGLAPGLYVKQLEMLKEIVPKASRIGLFVNNDFPLHTAVLPDIESSARRIGVTLRPVQVKVPEDIDRAFAAIARDNVGALFILGQPFLAAERVRVAKLAIDQRLPAISGFDIATEAGILASYAPRLVDDLRRLPHYVDRILKGTKPAELPVEQPTRFYLAINLQTATAIGLALPPSIVARADQLF